MKPNELREAIIKSLKGDNTYTNATDLPEYAVLEIIFGQQADAILDAVIASLPKQYTEDQGIDAEMESYNAALEEVTELLHSAKSISKEK